MKKIVIKKNSFKFNVRESHYRDFWRDLAANKWEPNTFKILNRFINHRHSYLDVGAWIGPTVLYAAHKAKKTYALEPDDVAYQELNFNVKLNSHIKSKIVCLNVALAPKKGYLPLYFKDSGDSIASFLERSDTANRFKRVKAITIQDLVKNYNLTDLDFIKIDIEGGEYSLIPSMELFIKQFKPTIYLSLHPGLLAENVRYKLSQKSSFINKLYQFDLFRRMMILFSSIIPTLKILKILSCYQYLYDEAGHPLTKWQIIFSKACVRLYLLVASDKKW